MKQSNSFLMRCIALVLALVLVVSNANLGVALQGFAVENGETTVTAGELVANNYELTEQERELLKSGFLVEESYSYSTPSNEDELVSVDTDNKKITVDSYENWVATTAQIVVGDETKETVDVVDGVATYTYDGNAFSVIVTYVLNIEVSGQENLLNAAAWLKADLANAAAVADQAGNLYILEQAMPSLVDVANNGITTSAGSTGFDSQEAVDAINALNDQMTANGGKLDLSVRIENYDSGASKAGWLVSNGAAMRDDAADLANKVTLISKELDTLLDNLAIAIEWGLVSAETIEQLELLANVCNNLETGLTAPVAAEWTASELGTELVKADADFVALDALLAAIETVTAAPEVKNPLYAATATVQANLSMNDVTVTYVLKVVENVVGSSNLVECEKVSVTVTLPTGATAEEVAAAVEATGIWETAKETWGEKYVEGAYQCAVAAEWPETLTEDLDVTVVYEPVFYAITTNYEDDQQVRYGYQYTLPKHENPAQAYDYTVNGVAYAQGEVITITGATEITRSAGKAYNVKDLYTVIADNYGNDVVKGILSSGALFGNEVVRYRKPDPADSESLLTLVSNVLTAAGYDSDYANLSWAPYTYGAAGTENFFSGNEAEWASKEAKVQYILSLTNFGAARAEEVLALAGTLKTEAAAQVATLNRLNNYHGDMGQLNKGMLAALNGMIDAAGFTTEMHAYFKALVGDIMTNNLDTDGNLKLYNMLTKYQDPNNGGLRYYYFNSEAVINEIASLSDNLNGLVGDAEKEACLATLLGMAGKPEYIDKIAKLGQVMAEVKRDLTAPNAAIDLESENLGKLITALNAEGEVEVAEEVGAPYILSDVLTIVDESMVYLQVIVNIGKDSATFTTVAFERGEVLTAEMVAALEAQIDAFVAEKLGDKAKYYDVEVVGGNLDELSGKQLDAKTNIYYTYELREYVARVEGTDAQIVTIEDLEINLPAHEDTENFRYEYTVDGETVSSGVYTFTAEQLERLFVNGEYTITRTLIDVKQEEMEDKFDDLFGPEEPEEPEQPEDPEDPEQPEDPENPEQPEKPEDPEKPEEPKKNVWKPVRENGKLVGLEATIIGDANGVMSFATDLMALGFAYIGLNGEPLMYTNEENTLQVSVQTLINAILNDNGFNSDRVIALGQNNGGLFLNATMQVGNTADSTMDLAFTMKLDTVPSQFVTAANGLNAVRNYVQFYSNNGQMNVDLTLPELVYEAYLTGLIGLNQIDKTDVNAMNTAVAVNFLYDYFVDVIGNENITTTTYQNSLEILDDMVNDLTDYDIPDYDLEAYEKYYQLLRSGFDVNGGNVIIVDDPEYPGYDLSFHVPSNGINAAMDALGINLGMYQGMIAELNDPSKSIDVTMVGTVVNAEMHHEAAILDVRGAGYNGKFDYTNDLVARLEKVTGETVVMLLDDVNGDLHFPDLAVLDLNGKTVNGSISGNVYVFDSTMGTADAGTVTGSVSSDVTVVAGNYTADVSANVPDGYKQVGTTVQNAYYTIECDAEGNVTFVVNTDCLSDEAVKGYLPNVPAIAADIALDIATNYYMCAALTVNDHDIYGLYLGDPLGLWASEEPFEDLVNMIIGNVSFPGGSDLVNDIIADLLDLGAIKSAIENGEPVATYDVTLEPITVAIEHIYDDEHDHLSLALTSDPDYAEDFSISLKFEGENKSKIAAMVGYLDEIVTDNTMAEIHVEQPLYDDRTLYVDGSVEAVLDLDLTGDESWQTILAVVLAYGNEHKADALVNAIGSSSVLRDIFDDMTVAEVFTALKEMQIGVSLNEMAEAVGVEFEITELTELEKMFRALLTGIGKALDELDVTGFTDKTMGMIREGAGRYVLSYSPDAFADVTRRGFTLDVAAVVEQATFAVDIFEDDCLWGDANHDGVVDTDDAVLVERYAVGHELNVFCTVRTDVNGDGSIDTDDAALIRMYTVGSITVFPAENK